MNDSKLYQKPNSELVYQEFEVPFEIVHMPEFGVDEISINDNKKLVENFLGDNKVMITPKKSFIDVDLKQHFD